jgi:hypothetical protein
MTHIRQESTLGATGHLSQIPGFSELFLGPLPFGDFEVKLGIGILQLGGALRTRLNPGALGLHLPRFSLRNVEILPERPAGLHRSN